VVNIQLFFVAAALFPWVIWENQAC